MFEFLVEVARILGVLCLIACMAIPLTAVVVLTYKLLRDD